MKLILLSGGSGKRLWPLSNEARSKQFLRVLPGDGGAPVSMLQRVWSQLAEAGLQEQAYLCAGKGQADVIGSQVGRVPVIFEPERRDTFAAIALSTLYLKDVARAGMDEVVVVMPVDPYVEAGYYDAIRKLEEVIRESGCELALVGAKPTYPSNKYGYIRVDQEAQERAERQGYVRVRSFHEKPDVDVAEQFLTEGALWNCGVFGFRLQFLVDRLVEKGLPTTYAALLEQYRSVPQNSFDYEVAEETERIVVVPYEGIWKDLGTWNTLTEEMAATVTGTGVMVDCQETHLINELNIPVAAVGLNQVVVAASADGILVAEKSHSQKVKELVKGVALRPMMEEKRWGTYRVLDAQQLEAQEVLTKYLVILAGKNLSYQRHFKRREVWTVLEGIGWMILDGELQALHPGDVVKVEVGQWHAVKADADLKIIEVQHGSELVEEDIERLYMTWEEMTAALALDLDGREVQR